MSKIDIPVWSRRPGLLKTSRYEKKHTYNGIHQKQSENKEMKTPYKFACPPISPLKGTYLPSLLCPQGLAMVIAFASSLGGAGKQPVAVRSTQIHRRFFSVEGLRLESSVACLRRVPWSGYSRWLYSRLSAEFSPPARPPARHPMTRVAPKD